MALPSLSRHPLLTEPEYWSLQQFLSYMRQHWQLGQHITVLGPTGCGKTYLNASLLAMRQYVCVVATKANDRTLIEQYKKYSIIHDWKDRHWTQQRVLFWPEIRTLEEGKNIYPKIHTLLDSVYIEKRWTLAIDDLKKVVYDRTCKEDMQVMMTQARSQDISIVVNGQSPIGIKVMECLDQASYWCMFHQKDDERNCDRMASIAGVKYKQLVYLNSLLKEYEFLFLSEKGEPVIVRKRV